MLMLWRLLPAITAICASTIIVFVCLAVLQFNQIRSELERERVSVLADRTAAPFEAAARIGLPLSSVRNASVLVERALQADPAIVAVYVVDRAGNRIASAGAEDPEINAATVFGAVSSREGKVWSGETASGYFSGIRIVDVAGNTTGGVVILYSGSESAMRSWAMAGKLIVGGLVGILLLLPAIAVALRVALHREMKGYDRIEAEVLAFERDTWRAHAVTATPSPPPQVQGPFHALLHDAEESYRRALHDGAMSPGQSALAPDATPVSARFRGRIVVVLAALIPLALIPFSMFTVSAFDQAIAPELKNRTALIGGLIRSEIQRTLELGIPITGISGLTPYVGAALADFPEIDRIAVVQADGGVIAEAWRDEATGASPPDRVGDGVGVGASDLDLPVLAGTKVVASIHVRGSPRFLETKLRDVLQDVSVLTIAVLLIGVEITLALVSATIWKPQNRIMKILSEQRQGSFVHQARAAGLPVFHRLATRLNDHAQDIAAKTLAVGASASGIAAAPLMRLRLSELGDIRLPLFMLAVGTEVTASFLPILASNVARPGWLPAEFAAAAPIVAYLAGVAALSPFSGRLSRRFGARRIFLFSILPVLIALVAMALADGVVAVTLARGLIALFYATATIACQEYALAAARPDETDRATGAFIGTILAGTFCGSVVGGVVASRFGYPVAILTGCAFVIAAGLAALLAMKGRAGDPEHGRKAVTPEASGSWAGSLSFVGLVLGIGVPTSAVTAAFIWYLTPLALAGEGLRPADVARVMMTYYLAAIILGPVVSSSCTGGARATASVLTGAAICGCALLSLTFWTGAEAFAVTVMAVGVGHAMIRSPLNALAVRFASHSTGPMDVLRLLDRLGAMAGLIAAASLKSAAGSASIPIVLGSVVVVGAAVFILASLARKSPREG